MASQTLLLSQYALFARTFIHSDIKAIQECGKYFVSTNHKTYYDVDTYVSDVIKQFTLEMEKDLVECDISLLDALRCSGIIDYIK